jgi:hypothetical protein
MLHELFIVRAGITQMVSSSTEWLTCVRIYECYEVCLQPKFCICMRCGANQCFIVNIMTYFLFKFWADIQFSTQNAPLSLSPSCHRLRLGNDYKYLLHQKIKSATLHPNWPTHCVQRLNSTKGANWSQNKSNNHFSCWHIVALFPIPCRLHWFLVGIQSKTTQVHAESMMEPTN